MKTLILEAYAKSEYGDSPCWAKVNLTGDFVKRVCRMSGMCVINLLRSVTSYESPDEWDLEEELRLSHDWLEVFEREFWFTAQPKHADYEVETRSMRVEDLSAAFHGQPCDLIVEGDMVYQNINAKDAWLEHLASQTNPE